MQRKVVGFSKDDEGHWRAKLQCGHYQHVRHDPPLRSRQWVLSEEGRTTRLGQSLECKKCDEHGLPDFLNVDQPK